MDSNGFHGGTTGTFDHSAASLNAGDGAAEKIGGDADKSGSSLGDGPSDRTDRSSRSPLRHAIAMVLAVLALGVVIGLIGGGLSRFYDWAQQAFIGVRESAAHPNLIPVPAWRRFAAVAAGGCIAALVWYFLRAKGRRIPSVAGAVAGQEMPAWETAIQVVAEFFMVATGASVGKEVAPREIGAMLSQQWMCIGRRTGLDSTDVHLLAAAGAGAGFASVYISPLAGTFFAAEMLLRRINFETICVSLGMSSIAALIGALMNGSNPYYLLRAPDAQAFEWKSYCIAIVVAPLFGLAGGLFRKLASRANTHRTTDRRILWQLPAASAATGLVAMAVPAMMSNGRLLAQVSFDATATSSLTIGSVAFSRYALAGMLIVLAAVKMTLTLLTLRSGAGGGTLTPSISVGACIGAALGLVVAPLISGVHVWQCALCGAVGVLAAAQEAPLMAIAMLLEISHLPVSFAVPFGVVAGLAIMTLRLSVEKR